MEQFIASFFVNIIRDAEVDISAPSRHRRSLCRVDPMEMRDDEFRKKFRLPKHMAIELMNMLEPLLPKKDISVKTKVLCALNFFGTGSYQTPVGNNYLVSMSQPSVSRCVEEVVVALNNPIIFGEWVKFPENFQEMNHIVRDFYQLYGFPGVIGCIDCTHVAIVPPPSAQFDERSYVNRKGYHSINTQLICDTHLRILNVNSLFPGSTHDAHIWNNSNVRTLLENLNDHGHTNYHLLGDSGYALRPWCLTPLIATEHETPEFYYSEALKKARSTIERCNGVLKSRFRCLIKDRVLHYKPSKASKIINACTVLHNMCIARQLEYPDLILDEVQLGMLPQAPYNDIAESSSRSNFLLQSARIKQASIIQNYYAQ